MAGRFSKQMIPNLIQPFWAACQGGEFLTDAAALAGTHRHRGLAWLREAGGVRPRRGLDLQGRYLSFTEREELALGRAEPWVLAVIATLNDWSVVDDHVAHACFRARKRMA
jgi:IS30 family transposase